MPSKWRASAPVSRGALLLLSASARAHAHAARRLDCPVVAVDGFADADLEADECLQVTLEDGQFTEEALAVVAERSHACDRLAYGSGFEAHPELLTQMAWQLQVLGNAPDIVRLCADGVQLATRLAELGLPVPETRPMAPDRPADWLVKRRGRSGGFHVHAAELHAEESGRGYWQRRCDGKPHSVLFLAGGGKARIVGISRLLPAEGAASPYAWGGAVGPVRLSKQAFDQVQCIVQTVARELELLGLCGIDFIMDHKDNVQVIDLNPRLTATCELYRDRFASGYLQAHLDACTTGRADAHVMAASDATDGMRGLGVVYAPGLAYAGADFAWPDAIADRPNGTAAVEAGQPLCTVHGRYADFTEACSGLQALRDQVLARFAVHASTRSDQEASHATH